jgi:hypothetical protein
MPFGPSFFQSPAVARATHVEKLLAHPKGTRLGMAPTGRSETYAFLLFSFVQIEIYSM